MSSANRVRLSIKAGKALCAAVAALWLGAQAAPALAASPGEHAAEHAAGPAGDHAGGHGAEHGHGDPTEHFNWLDMGYKSKDAAGGALEKGDEPMSPPMVVMLINFGIVLIILGWKVAPPVQAFVRNRHETIKNALEEAAQLRAEAKAKLDEYSEKLAEAEAEVTKLISDIRADAEAEKKRIIANAEAQAAAMKRDAEARIAAEIARARLALERDVVNAAVAVAEKLVRERATSDDQIKLIDTFISDVGAKASPSAGERA